MKVKILLFLLLAASWLKLSALDSKPQSVSFYNQKPEDTEAIYFTEEKYNIKADGRSDVSDALQEAINKLKLEQNFGIVFIPEGMYIISRTIYIPAAIRLIGYGTKRPLFVLKKKTPGYQESVESDKGKANYMFWFTGGVVEPGRPVNDAGAGTFYSAFSNIDIIIEDGNPSAVALRTHYAQHSFVSHCDIHTGNGKAGLFDIGNFMEDVRFFGGDYGIYTTKASPGWQFMMLDTYFEGQRVAAIKTQQAGLTIMRMFAKNVPKIIAIDSGFWEKLYMEDCQLVNVSNSAISFDDEGNTNLQINLRNVTCRNVPVVVDYLKSGRQTIAPGPIFNINRYVYGLQMDDLDALPVYNSIFETEVFSKLPSAVPTDNPSLPPMTEWKNLKELGAKGDGQTDDTKIIQEAINNYRVIYVPQGWYMISEPLKLKPNTVMIGLHPIATQFILEESSKAFSGFGHPVPLIEAPQDGTNIFTGIGLSTGEYNYRAVACKWMAGEKSMLCDVKFVGGHGSMTKGPVVPRTRTGNQDRKPVPVQGPDPAWDTQYWSLWITKGGGGVFKNIWTANSYATSGIYVSNTSSHSRIYAMSVEHHVRNEVRFSNVSNWKVYALQLEEESREGIYCQPMEICNCSDMMFANLYLFRVIRFKTPYPYSVRTWDCTNIELLNIHNYSQIKYTTDNPLYDINTDTDVRPVEMSSLFISGKTLKNSERPVIDQVKKLAGGFEFAEGICSDSKGNIYFCEQRLKRIYKWSAESGSLILLADYQWQPLSLGCDSEDNLLVVCRYDPQYGHMINGEQERFVNPPDASGTSFSMWGNSGFTTLAYSVDPDDPDETIRILDVVPMASVDNVYKALYPSNRWRDYHDFYKMVVNPNEECFIAPDGVTIIPICYDLARSSALSEAYPGKNVYICDEYDKRTVRLDVDSKGYLSDAIPFAEKGEFCSIEDNEGNVYIADGDIYMFDSNGLQTGFIHIPERPSTLAIGGKDHNTLFITGRTALYSVDLKK
jgi:hypothetical protein